MSLARNRNNAPILKIQIRHRTFCMLIVHLDPTTLKLNLYRAGRSGNSFKEWMIRIVSHELDTAVERALFASSYSGSFLQVK